jgi:hypothetical protein
MRSIVVAERVVKGCVPRATDHRIGEYRLSTPSWVWVSSLSFQWGFQPLDRVSHHRV